MKVECKGKCGRQVDDIDRREGGYAKVTCDKVVEWICDECWRKGVRTKFDEQRVAQPG